ncbi:MAG: hypothetical protein H7831_12425 [Magnetococcus sp. WYHC-3]
MKNSAGGAKSVENLVKSGKVDSSDKPATKSAPDTAGSIGIPSASDPFKSPVSSGGSPATTTTSSNPGLQKSIRHSVEVDTRSDPGTVPSVPEQSAPSQEEVLENKKDKPFAPAVDLTGLDAETAKNESEIPEINKADRSGIFGDKLLEPIAKYVDTPGEIVHSNLDSYIVLGRDRPGSRASGYSGQGDTGASSIDIVTGRVPGTKKVNENNEPLLVDPSMKFDAARILVSQKTDIDKNFDLVDGQVGHSKTKSGIAVKADGIRIIGREGVKIISGGDRRNSQGGVIRTVPGIDLIAGNDDSDLQPMVKGQNLAKALERIVNHLNSLSGIVNSFMHIQFKYNADIAGHFHYSPFFGLPNTPSEVLVPSGMQTNIELLTKVSREILTLKKNLGSFRVTYLSVYGKKYICSRQNHVN